MLLRAFFCITFFICEIFGSMQITKCNSSHAYFSGWSDTIQCVFLFLLKHYLNYCDSPNFKYSLSSLRTIQGHQIRWQPFILQQSLWLSSRDGRLNTRNFFRSTSSPQLIVEMNVLSFFIHYSLLYLLSEISLGWAVCGGNNNKKRQSSFGRFYFITERLWLKSLCYEVW